MNFTSRSRYALKIMMDLAYHSDQPHVHRRDIAKRHGIPQEYMDQILMRLRSGGMVQSVRGRGGGYRLAKADDAITLWDLFLAAEGSLDPVQCVGEDCRCDFQSACVSKTPWQVIYQALKDPLEKMTLREMVGLGVPMHQLCPGGGLRECKPPHMERSSAEMKLALTKEASW